MPPAAASIVADSLASTLALPLVDTFEPSEIWLSTSLAIELMLTEPPNENVAAPAPPTAIDTTNGAESADTVSDEAVESTVEFSM